MKTYAALLLLVFCLQINMLAQEKPIPLSLPPPKYIPPQRICDFSRYSGCEGVKDRSERNKCGMDKMKSFFQVNVKYPEKALRSGIEGTVFVQFRVQKDGSIAEFEIIKSIGPEYSKEVLRVMKLMPPFSITFSRGRPYSCKYSVPIRFVLLDEESPARGFPY